jgi:hypothetical protein
MADTLRIVVDEIRTTINQVFDDKSVTRAQVAFWVITIGNKLLGQHIVKRDSGKFLNVYIVPVIDPKENKLPSIIKGRKYIELPAAIFDFDRDAAVEYMAYYDPNENCEPEYRKKKIQRSSPSEMEWLTLHDKTKPSPKNCYFERIGDIFRIAGLESVPVKQVEIGIYQMISSLTDINLDDEFNFPPELLSDLKRQVTDLARYSFLFPEMDNRNDGAGQETGNQGKPIQKIMSVNEQNQAE